MSTKSTIQALSDANIADASNITASEHRAVNDSFIDEFYGTAIEETQAANTITAQTSAANFYFLNFCKQGRKVRVVGTLINKQTVITSNTTFFEVVDAEYLPDPSISVNHKIYGNNSVNNSPVRLSFNASNELGLSASSLGVGQNIYVDFEYLTQD